MDWSFKQNPGVADGNAAGAAKSILVDMEALLSNVYADMNVSRDRVRSLVERGEKLAGEGELGGSGRSEEFLDSLYSLEKKIYKTLDLKKLKEEGLVKVVPL